jgi:hypothetical protein
VLAAALLASGLSARAQITRAPLLRPPTLNTFLPLGAPGLRQTPELRNGILLQPALTLTPASRLILSPALPSPARPPQIITPQRPDWIMSPAGVYLPAAPAPISLDTAGSLQAQADLRNAPLSALSRIFDGSGLRAARMDLAPAGPARPLSDQLEGKTGAALLSALHDISGRGYRAREYGEASKYMFSTSDNVTINGVRGVIDAYSDIFVAGTSGHGNDYPEHGDQNGDGTVDRGMNVEHVWPQSFFGKELPMRSDLHHLLPTFIGPNGIRSNLPFGEVTGKPEYSNKAGAKMGAGVFEPPNSAKGRVARAVLYFYMRYYDRNIRRGDFGLGFFAKRLDMFLRWNRQHPPDPDEVRRNGSVEAFQGNRNPFVDATDLADKIGIDGFISKIAASGKTVLSRGDREHMRRLDQARAQQNLPSLIRGLDFSPN